jgi:hypothetical protein
MEKVHKRSFIIHPIHQILIRRNEGNETGQISIVRRRDEIFTETLVGKY